MSLPTFLSILTCVVASTCAQLFLKAGAVVIADERALVAMQPQSLTNQILSFINYPLAVGLFLYAGSAAFWVWVLARVEVSTAYPFISLGFILTLVIGVSVFGESLTLNKVLGCGFILVGCFVISQ